MTTTDKLKNVLAHLKQTFVGKDEIIDLLGIALLARENAFLYGPPGTAKSAIVRMMSQSVVGGANFEYLLTRFTEPNEIFGPFDIRKLKEGELTTNTAGMLPEASLVFLDEIFNANSAILNSLLMALNERVFRRGQETRNLPALMFVGASNGLPEDEALAALLDRFLVRVRCDYVDPELLDQVLLAGRKLEKQENEEPPTITPEELKDLQKQTRAIDLGPVRNEYIALVHSLRNTGVKVSDRRAVKVQNLVAASALMCGRTAANLSDLWVLRYIWDTEEQIEVLAGIVDAVVKKEASPDPHPQATGNTLPNAETLMQELQSLTEQWEKGTLSLEEQNVLKDKLRHLQTRCNWVANEEHKQHLREAVESLWQKMLQTV